MQGMYNKYKNIKITYCIIVYYTYFLYIQDDYHINNKLIKNI